MQRWREPIGSTAASSAPSLCTMAKNVSKLLSYWLRHAPQAGELVLDGSGWAQTGAVRHALARAGVDPASLERTIADNDKQRFELSPDGSRVRARQGHSVAGDGDWPIAAPPEHLYHGTVKRVLAAILAEGLRPMARHHVHLSADLETATRVGARRGSPIVLQVAAGRMARDGSIFRRSRNGVWLTDAVPPGYLARV